MKRRAYLTTAGAVVFAGCSALSDSETADETNDDNGSDDSGTDGGSSDPIDEDPGSFDEFEDLSKWTVREGSMTADQDRVYTGTQSARLDADASTERVMIKREFETPRDLSDEFPALAFASDQEVNPVVQLTDVDENRLLLKCAVEPDGPFEHHNLAVAETVGDPDLSQIMHTKISMWAGDREMSLWCDDYHFVDRPDTGKVLLQFPKGTDSAATAASTLADHDFPATVFVNTDYVGGDGRLSVEDLESLQNDGWTIASQGATNADLTQLDRSAQEAEISAAASWLGDHGFDDAYFSYPLNRYDESALEVVEEHHDLAFVGGFAGHADLSNPYIAPRAVNPSADEATSLLEFTATYNTITTLSYRDLAGGARSDFEAAVSKLADLEAAGDIEVVLPEDLASNHVHD